MKKTFNKIRSLIQKNNIIVLFIYFLLTGIVYTTSKLNNFEINGIIFRSVVLLSFLLCAFLCFVNKKLFENRKLVLLTLGFIFLSLLSISVNSLLGNVGNIKILLYGIGDIFIIPITLILFLNLNISNNRLLSYITHILIGLVSISILASLMLDFDEIVLMVNNFDHSNYDVTSIFVDKNTFGFFLFIGGSSCLIEIYRNRKFFILFLIFFFLYSILIRSKTSCLLLFILLINGLILIFKNLTHKNFLIYGSILLSFLILFTVLIIFKIGFFSKINSLIFDKYGLFYDAKIVFLDRIRNWSNAIKQQNNIFNIILGFGERTPHYLMGTIDNCYIYNYVCGGLFKLTAYIFLIIYLILKNRTSYIYVLLIILIIAYGFFQDYQLLGFNFYSLGFLLILKICKN